jgi:RNA recognition motif-containing protein
VRAACRGVLGLAATLHSDRALLLCCAAGFRGVKLMTRTGYGFVDFESQQEAMAALLEMQGQPIGERALRRAPE